MAQTFSSGETLLRLEETRSPDGTQESFQEAHNGITSPGRPLEHTISKTYLVSIRIHNRKFLKN